MPEMTRVHEAEGGEVIRFEVVDGERRSHFEVSRETLEDAIGDRDHTAMQNFERLRARIETAAFAKVAQIAVTDDDGRIRLRRHDLA